MSINQKDRVVLEIKLQKDIFVSFPTHTTWLPENDSTLACQDLIFTFGRKCFFGAKLQFEFCNHCLIIKIFLHLEF